MPHPLFIQEPGLMEKYVEAAARVMANLDAALAAPRPKD
jgi:hypothetical protein